jgi:hypothetical protein
MDLNANLRSEGGMFWVDASGGGDVTRVAVSRHLPPYRRPLIIPNMIYVASATEHLENLQKFPDK